jgi:hypothetical protein
VPVPVASASPALTKRTVNGTSSTAWRASRRTATPKVAVRVCPAGTVNAGGAGAPPLRQVELDPAVGGGTSDVPDDRAHRDVLSGPSLRWSRGHGVDDRRVDLQLERLRQPERYAEGSRRDQFRQRQKG